jgi:hypothetical protein
LPGTPIVNDGIAMAKAVDALRPWRDNVVIVGGWAHRLHRLDPRAIQPSYNAVVTRDADVAFDAEIRLEGDIGAALKQAGFNKILMGEHVPPVSHFQFGEENVGFFIEFLTPLRGRGMRRDGSEDATMAAAGMTAQKLRHFNVLLTAPWKIDLVPLEQLPLAESTHLNVANPVSFIVQKLLIHLWREHVAPSLTQKELKEAKERTHLIFERISDTLREAVRIPVDRRIDPEEFRLRCEIGLEQLFGSDT